MAWFLSKTQFGFGFVKAYNSPPVCHHAGNPKPNSIVEVYVPNCSFHILPIPHPILDVKALFRSPILSSLPVAFLRITQGTALGLQIQLA